MGRLACCGHGASLRWLGTIGCTTICALMMGGGRSGGGAYDRSCGWRRSPHPSPAPWSRPSELRSVMRRLYSGRRGTASSLSSPMGRPTVAAQGSIDAGLKSVGCLRYSVVSHRASAPALLGCVGTRGCRQEEMSVAICPGGGW
eukprot:scaffold130998_cov60-Phaeocystis_antarctica.AAC.4